MLVETEGAARGLSTRRRNAGPCLNVGDFSAHYRGPMAGTEIVFVVEEAPEGGLIAQAVGESIITEADDLVSLREMVRDAVICHFDDGERPTVVRLHLVHDELIAV